MTDDANMLGRLERVDPRSIWKYEDKHFTPWLAEEDNLELLGKAIGFQLELEAQEKDVGPFRADILCKDVSTEDWVLIENQLERTDHSHLGQLITYAAGLKAVTIVWIANPFTEEHRAALDWLNEITDSSFNFFGLEIELWRIGDSHVAPKFNVACKPNDWSRTVGEGVKVVEKKELTQAKLLQLRFWTAFRAFADARETQINATKPLPQHWMNVSIGRSGFKLNAIASVWNNANQTYDTQELRSELVIDGASAKSFFNLLEEAKDDIERELGFELTWYAPENANNCRIYVTEAVNLKNEDDWPTQHQWLLDHLETFYSVFRPRIQNLSIS